MLMPIIGASLMYQIQTLLVHQALQVHQAPLVHRTLPVQQALLVQLPSLLPMCLTPTKWGLLLPAYFRSCVG